MPKEEGTCVKIIFQRIFAILSNFIPIMISCFSFLKKKTVIYSESGLPNFVYNLLNILDIFQKKICCFFRSKPEEEKVPTEIIVIEDDIERANSIISEKKNKIKFLKRLKAGNDTEKEKYLKIKELKENIQSI